MSTSERTFNQVKAILQKLDRSIDQAREKRMRGNAENPPSRPAAAGPYGRATPLPTSRPGTERWTP